MTWSGSRHSDEWALLASFSWLQDALLLRSRLEGEGIAVRIPEEFTASIHPGTTAMQVRVLVPVADLAQARELLNAPPDEDAPNSSKEACAFCGATESRRAGGFFRNAALALAALLFFIPVRKSEIRVCAGCGRPWKSG